MARIEQKQNDWLEPFQNWIKVACSTLHFLVPKPGLEPG